MKYYGSITHHQNSDAATFSVTDGVASFFIIPFFSSDDFAETVPLTAETVNRTSEKIGPECFELLKVLGKGGYGKVSCLVVLENGQWVSVCSWDLGECVCI